LKTDESDGEWCLVDIPVQNGREINECIYCGSREPPLTKEHAVPYGLNGPWTLLKASCEACAKITHRFERDTLRSLWPEIRNALAMQTRRPEKRSETLPLVVQREGGDLEKIQVPRSEYPIYLSTPLFPPPAMFWRSEPVRGVFTNFGIIHVAGPTFMEASKKYPGAKFVGGHTNFSPEEFARTLAKISFCAGVCALGLGAFTNTPIRDVILGKNPCIGHWVGTWHAEPMNDTHRGLHGIKVLYNKLSLDIHAFVRLFAQFGAPEYHIVLGKPDPSFVASDEWPLAWREEMSHNG
jgi:hypothetical protein